jgi:putative ABC transport system ATP-binding protein
MALIEVKNLVKIYEIGGKELAALNGISLNVDYGEMVAITGASGSGKSTLMNVLGCLDKVTEGQYFLEKMDVLTLSDDELAHIRNKKIGFVFQSFNLLSGFSALENVELPLIYSKMPKKRREKRAHELLYEVGLSGRKNHHPNQLSGGERQRVAIARALVNSPDIILADEPTGNLDSKTSHEIISIFQRLNTEKNVTVIIVTHEQQIAKFTKRVVTLHDGKIIDDKLL